MGRGWKGGGDGEKDCEKTKTLSIHVVCELQSLTIHINQSQSNRIAYFLLNICKILKFQVAGGNGITRLSDV